MKECDIFMGSKRIPSSDSSYIFSGVKNPNSPVAAILLTFKYATLPMILFLEEATEIPGLHTSPCLRHWYPRWTEEPN